MKSSFFHTLTMAMLALAFGPAAARADITVRVSVKFILNNDAAHTHPAGTTSGNNVDIGSNANAFDSEVTYGNQVLAATGRGFQLKVVEYLDIQPPAPGGQASSYWFNLPARSSRQTIETAALADTTTWHWNPGAINIYVNNSTSGQCSFVGGGGSISLGASVGQGTVVHEIGHIFNLAHTHAGDYSTASNAAPANGIWTAANIFDGDAFAETPNDNPNISDHDQLTQALYGQVYASATAEQQAAVDRTFLNVMSYHTEASLLPVQMDYWTYFSNTARLGFCNGRTWFVADEGKDFYLGYSATAPLANLTHALSVVSTDNDVVLLRSGNYLTQADGTITKPCTLRATRGDVTVTRP